MAQFDKSYFLRHYRSAEDKSSPRKLSFYLSIIKKFTSRRVGKPTLLDVGCGYGKFLEMASHDFRITGIDSSSYAIREVRRFVPKVMLFVSTVEKFHSKRRYDIITAFDVLEHLENPRQVIEKIHRLLSDDGIFMCVVPVYDGPLGTIGGWLDRDPTHLQKWNRWQWFRLFETQFNTMYKAGIIRYTFPVIDYYFHISSRWFWKWGQALLIVLKKNDKRSSRSPSIQ